MLVVPGETPVTKPVFETDAIPLFNVTQAFKVAGVPVPINVTFPLIHVEKLPVLLVIVGKLLTITVELAVAEQPLPSTPVTV